jgi:cell wall-associated NlpC family hydrolase
MPAMSVRAQETRSTLHHEEIGIDLRAFLEQQIEQMDKEYWNLAIAQVDNYVNVRSLPSEEGEVLGKLYNNSVGELLKVENGWYQITSGNVTGYVKAEYCVTGTEAISWAKELETRIATAKTVSAYVKKDMLQESEVLGYLAMGDEVVVLEEGDEWCKVSIEEGDGYVLKELVRLHSEYVTAESKEEEAERLAKEAKEREEARKAALLAAQKEAENTVSAEPTEIGIEIANYACQFVGNPYKWGGISLTDGADCSGFVMSVYANFGVELPHSSAADRKVGYEVGSLDKAIPGDIVCYSGHVAIYIGGGQIVHASTERTGITYGYATYRTILAVRRVI